jgi:hypothetical protein
MFVDASDLGRLTGQVRPSAQARYLSKLGIKFTRAFDGSIVLRLQELDAHTLSRVKSAKRQWQPDLTHIDSK